MQVRKTKCWIDEKGVPICDREAKKGKEKLENVEGEIPAIYNLDIMTNKILKPLKYL